MAKAEKLMAGFTDDDLRRIIEWYVIADGEMPRPGLQTPEDLPVLDKLKAALGIEHTWEA